MTHSIEACQRCGSDNLRMAGIRDGVMVGLAQELARLTCTRCGLTAVPILFDDEEGRLAFETERAKDPSADWPQSGWPSLRMPFNRIPTIRACSNCGSQKLRIPGAMDGSVPKTDNLMPWVCQDCGRKATPIEFESQAAAGAFQQALRKA